DPPREAPSTVRVAPLATSSVAGSEGLMPMSIDPPHPPADVDASSWAVEAMVTAPVAFTTMLPARPLGTPGRPIVPTPTVPARSTFWAVREIVPPGGPIVSPGPARPTASTCAPASRVKRPATTMPREAWRTQLPGAHPASATHVVPGAAEQLPTK